MGPFFTRPRSALPLLLGAICSFTALFPGHADATFDITLTPSAQMNNGITLTWAAQVDPATPTAKITYYVYGRFGNVAPNSAFGSGDTQGSVYDNVTVTISTSAGTHCWKVGAWNTVSNQWDTSITRCHDFVHNPGASNEGIVRVDGNGTQLGFGQTWKFTYYNDWDALVSMKIYPPGTAFALDSNGFWDLAVPTLATKTVVDNTPRSSEMADGSISNTEVWDCRDSSGATVSNGLYYAHFTFATPVSSPSVRHKALYTIPVDIIRFTDFSTTGISDSQALANVNYAITGDASIRILVAKPGTKFTLDASGDVYPQAAGGAIDTSTTSVIQVITFNRKAGTYSETWNGTDLNGVSVSSGIYAVGISAKDGFGNKALDLDGNDGVIAGTLTVDRQASQSATDTTAPTITGITVGGTSISLAGGTSVGSSFSSVVISLDETAGTGGNESTVVLTDPGGTNVGGTVSTSGSDVTYSTATSMTSTGTYTLTVTPRDSVGNAGSATPYTFNIPSSAAGSVTDQSTFETNFIPYPNPVRSPPLNVEFQLDNTANVSFDIYNILGERVLHQASSYAAGTRTFTWNLSNDAGQRVGNGVYLLRITAQDSTQSLTSVKKVMVIQ